MDIIFFCLGQALDVPELLRLLSKLWVKIWAFQCPHGLELLHDWLTIGLGNKLFQCPLGLELLLLEGSADSGNNWVSMPSRAYTSFLRYPFKNLGFMRFPEPVFCSHLSEYSGNSRFPCMLTFWTYLMRYTYPWHWIKCSTKCNRCHPIFSLSW